MVLGVAVALLILDRIVRVGPFLEAEGFTAFGTPGAQIQMCGVDHPPCRFPLRCMNGFCRSEEAAALVNPKPLPVIP
jgi:hypothetical protein